MRAVGFPAWFQSALQGWIVFLGSFRAWSSPCRTRGPFLSYSHPASSAAVAVPRNVSLSSRLDQPKLDISSRVTEASPATDAGYSGEEAPVQSRGALSQRRCTASGTTWPRPRATAAPRFRSRATAAVFVIPVARASTDRFFTLCDEHLAQECEAERPRYRHELLAHAAGAAECLRCRHE